MIDEWYDRAYVQCRAELHAGIAVLFAKLALSAAPWRLRRPPTLTAGDSPCLPEPLSPSPPCR